MGTPEETVYFQCTEINKACLQRTDINKASSQRMRGKAYYPFSGQPSFTSVEGLLPTLCYKLRIFTGLEGLLPSLVLY